MEQFRRPRRDIASIDACSRHAARRTVHDLIGSRNLGRSGGPVTPTGIVIANGSFAVRRMTSAAMSSSDRICRVCSYLHEWEPPMLEPNWNRLTTAAFITSCRCAASRAFAVLCPPNSGTIASGCYFFFTACLGCRCPILVAIRPPRVCCLLSII